MTPRIQYTIPIFLFLGSLCMNSPRVSNSRHNAESGGRRHPYELQSAYLTPHGSRQEVLCLHLLVSKSHGRLVKGITSRFSTCDRERNELGLDAGTDYGPVVEGDAQRDGHKTLPKRRIKLLAERPSGEDVHHRSEEKDTAMNAVILLGTEDGFGSVEVFKDVCKVMFNEAGDVCHLLAMALIGERL